MFQPFAIALGGGGRRLRLRQRTFDAGDLGPGLLDRARIEPSERIEQRAVAACVQQPAIIVLAMDFDGGAADVAKRCRRNTGAPDERAARTIAFQRPPDD